MTVAIADRHIILSNNATVEDAERLLAALTDHPDFAIDVATLGQAHLAVVQLLHAARRRLVGAPTEAVLRALLSPD